MIIATAGHVDHGKTSLLKALTGVDADRLPEEKKRGLTIDLGYVYDDRIRPGTVIGFVDVPGHERFIHNMLAGVTAIRAALLVIAADDGPMPQTREHLAILDLIGVETGIVALTKTDLVDAARVAAVREEIAALLDGTSLADAPVLPVSAANGEGVETVRDALAGLAQGAADARQGHFRMPIDRCFHVSGAGLVVTGLVESGTVNVGDRLVVAPGGWPARVRGLRAQDRPTQEGVAGQRCAINLAGPDLDKDALHRGRWLVAAPLQAASRRLDARIRVLASEDRPLRSGAPVHVHIGTADVTGRIGLVATRAAEPGETVFAHLLLDRPVNVLHGDAVILRDQSARRTIGGGRILDPFAPARGHTQRAARLEALARPDKREALRALLAGAPGGLDLGSLETAWNLTPEAAQALADGGHVRCAMAGEAVGLSREHWDALRAAIVSALEKWHAANPERGGPNDAVLMRALPLRVHRVAFDAAVSELVAEGAVERQGALLRRSGHEARLTAKQQKLWARVGPALMSAEGRPQTVFEVAQAIGVDKAEVNALLTRAVDVGFVLRVSANRFMEPATLRQLASVAEAGAARSPDGSFGAADFRDWSGMGRNLSIEILEYFDRLGLTKRMGDARVIRRPVDAVFAAELERAPSAGAEPSVSSDTTVSC
ncbi:MAG: selenocysteine-specific translation elongation factor [Bauldia litoralis]